MIQQVNELFLISKKICDIYSSSIQKILKYLKKKFNFKFINFYYIPKNLQNFRNYILR